MNENTLEWLDAREVQVPPIYKEGFSEEVIIREYVAPEIPVVQNIERVEK